MVITVTLNPALDKTFYLDELSIGKVNRVVKERYDIGGKGINVSKVLKEFNIDSICTGFLGEGLEGLFKDELDKKGIDHDFVIIKGNTRENTKLIDIKNNINTDINQNGPIIRPEELNSFIDKFTSLCNENDIVVLSGTVSPSISNDIYMKLTNIAKDKGAYVIVDAEGELLENAIKAIPNAIKPNQYELETIIKKKFSSTEEIIEGAKTIINLGVDKVLVSLGEIGSILLTKTEILFGKNVNVFAKNTVGAGDSMVAALIYSLINDYTNIDTLAFAQSSGTASVILEGTEACNLKSVKSFFEESKNNIEKLNNLSILK